MTPAELAAFCTDAKDAAWAKGCRAYPELKKFPKPFLVYNNRLKTTAGRCFFDKGQAKIDLSTSLLWKHQQEFKNEIIPHEVAHDIAYKLFQDEGHGPDWKRVMISLGLEPFRCHNLFGTGRGLKNA